MAKEETAVEVYKKQREETRLRNQEMNFLIDMERDELFNYIRDQDILLSKADTIIEDSITISDHWKQFHDYLEENEDFKAEWDMLCMAMKLKDT